MMRDLITIRSEHLCARIAPSLGASVVSLESQSGEPVLRPVDVESIRSSSDCASFSLVPFSNRIRDARFVFDGRDVQLRATTADGLTQHGDVRNRSWDVRLVEAHRLVASIDSRDVADMNWPWPFTCEVCYECDDRTFATTLTVRNVSDEPMPAGVGMHPYFVRWRGGVDATLTADASRVYDVDERRLPVAAARRVTPSEDMRDGRTFGSAHVDGTWTEWGGTATLSWPDASITLTADKQLSHLVIYTAPDGSLALEPVSHAVDAFNLAARGVPDVGMHVLAPDESMCVQATITISPSWR